MDLKYQLAAEIERLLNDHLNLGPDAILRITKVSNLMFEVKVTEANGPRYFNVRVSEML